MTIPPGTRVGPYEILALLGAGGMGEVYKARDTRLHRSVALKILSPDLSHDPEYRERFQIEARAISSLNHPHICALYDVGEAPMPVVPDTSHQPSAISHQPSAMIPVASVAISHDVVHFLVMELLEGNTLAQRLIRGALPFDQALRTAIEIASALDAAHAQGVTHRDLKPSNVMLTKSGAKLLDFGLAKLHDVANVAGVATRTFDPTFTAEGAVLGTFHYMAPEQVEGKAVDARADLFAFGALLYEMVTGRKAFEGQSQASLTAAILAREPPSLSGLEIPPAFDHVIRRCLAKDPDERWQSARDVVFELKWIAERGVEQSAARPTRRRAIAVAWSVAGLAALIAIATVAMQQRQPIVSGAPVQLEVSLPEGASLPAFEVATSLAVSPDGHHIAFTASHDGRTQLWLRSFDALTARALPGTDGARSPFWSPDSRSVGFGAPGKLQRVDLSGGPPQLISNANVWTAPTWGSRGTILFAELSAGRQGIFRVSSDGGPVTQVTTVDRQRQEREHFWPSFLPDGIHFFYLVSTALPDAGGLRHTVYVASLDRSDVIRVEDVDSRMTYAAPGHVLYAQDGALLARRFDLATLRLAGDPVPIAERLWYLRPTGVAEFSVSDNGLLAFHQGLGVSELVWFDRTGTQRGTVGARTAFSNLRLSPDGRRVAVEAADRRSGSGDLWIYDTSSGIPTAFTSDPMLATHPVWSGDGLHVFFESARDGPPDIYRRRADGRGAKELVGELDGVETPEDASPDGRFLVFRQNNRTTGNDLAVYPLAGGQAPRVFLATPAHEFGARFSPDGQWLAFVSTESETPEVYVAPFDEPGARKRVSSAGGMGPRWRSDGKELVYLALDNTLMAVPLNLGQELRPGVPRPLFTPGRVLRVPGGIVWDPAYEVSADGQRFLVNRVIEDASRAPITVVLNWPALLRK